MEERDRMFHNLTNHPPINQDIFKSMERIRQSAKNLVEIIIDNVPFSREYSLSLTKLEECVMWAIAAIARNQPDEII